MIEVKLIYGATDNALAAVSLPDLEFTCGGMIRLRSGSSRTGCEKSSSPSTAISLNLQTFRWSSDSVHASARWKIPL